MQQTKGNGQASNKHLVCSNKFNIGILKQKCNDFNVMTTMSTIMQLLQ